MNEDKIIAKLVEIDNKLDTFVTKVEFSKFREEVLSGQDVIVTTVKRLDDERLVSHKRVTDLEDKVEKNTDDIKQVKVQLKMA